MFHHGGLALSSRPRLPSTHGRRTIIASLRPCWGRDDCYYYYCCYSQREQGLRAVHSADPGEPGALPVRQGKAESSRLQGEGRRLCVFPGHRGCHRGNRVAGAEDPHARSCSTNLPCSHSSWVPSEWIPSHDIPLALHVPSQSHFLPHSWPVCALPPVPHLLLLPGSSFPLTSLLSSANLKHYLCPQVLSPLHHY